MCSSAQSWFGFSNIRSVRMIQADRFPPTHCPRSTVASVFAIRNLWHLPHKTGILHGAYDRKSVKHQNHSLYSKLTEGELCRSCSAWDCMQFWNWQDYDKPVASCFLCILGTLDVVFPRNKIRTWKKRTRSKILLLDISTQIHPK